jgi:hypothetical protein
MNVNEHHLVAEKEFGQFVSAHPPFQEIGRGFAVLDENLNASPAEAVDVFLLRQANGGQVAVLFKFEESAVESLGMAMHESAHLIPTEKPMVENQMENLNIRRS